MSKLSTLNYLVNSYYDGKKEVETLQFIGFPSEYFEACSGRAESEPSQSSIDAILRFASQYEVLHSRNSGNIELNLN